MAVKQQLNFIHNSIVCSVFIQMWMFTGACFYPYTNAVMCYPLLTSLPVVCPFLFPWYQLWQDETVVVCLPVYTCCADLLLLYSRHRQADRWQPHWHQSRGPLALPLTSINLQGFHRKGVNNKDFLILNYVSTSQETCCFNLRCVLINLWWLKCTAVSWLRYLLIHKAPKISLKITTCLVLIPLFQAWMWVWMAYLIILEPGQVLWSEDKPVFLGSTLHDADVADGQPALAYDLNNSQG